MLSFEDRDPLASEISSYGWRVSSVRRSDELRRRFLSCNALISLIDARTQTELALTAVTELKALASEGGIAILALGDQAVQSDIAERSFEAGATHFLDIGNPAHKLKPAIDFAYRYVEHMRGGSEATRDFSRLLTEEDQEWSFPKRQLSKSWVSEALRSKIPAVNFDIYPATGIYRMLATEERRRVRGAMGRLKDGSAQAAVPHELDGENVIHHLHDDGSNIVGRIEFVSHTRDIENWADRDLLSGLRNPAVARSWIKEKLEAGADIGVVILGIKNFKTINAAYGRRVGDQVLRLAGQQLLGLATDEMAEEHIVARIDGQNFLVAANIATTDQLVIFAQKLSDRLSSSLPIDGRSIRLLTRAGIAFSKKGGDEVDLVRSANLSLAEAMASDTTTPKVSDLSHSQIALEQELEGQLAIAITRDEIAIALQPQVKTRSGQLIGAEALARWDHPQFGVLGAGTLIAVAERAGLMPLLSSHIHDRALAVAARWPESLSFLRLSINVTAGDLAKWSFVEDIQKKIENSGFPIDRITLEITESELIEDIDGSAVKLEELRETGLRIAIDDFGSGYSSLSYLKALPLDYLKIDSGLTGDISGSEKDQLVVRSIIDLAHSLKLQVIAEGVETEAQLESLTKQGCEFFQGFLRSGPLFPEEFESFALRSN